ncbi:hypothetical protein ACFWXK_18340 [Streptomyces sp. NPDC059070]|uniref:hypothetical protein n=1 Tax=unclassified Streptomyces TaxID=2593676 RepID=UPI0034E1AA07
MAAQRRRYRLRGVQRAQRHGGHAEVISGARGASARKTRSLPQVRPPSRETRNHMTV